MYMQVVYVETRVFLHYGIDQGSEALAVVWV